MVIRFSLRFSLPVLAAVWVFLLSTSGVAAPLKVAVAVPPHAYLAERIGGKYVEVITIIDKGQDPHTFEPKPRQLTQLSQTKVFLSAGLPFEDVLLKKIKGTRQAMRVVDLSESNSLSEKSVLREQDHRDEEHHEDDDLHTWLSPGHLSVQAEKISKAFAGLLPDKLPLLQKNLFTFQQELKALDTQIKNRLAPFKGRTFYVFHPAFGYFGQAYGLHQEAVEAGGSQPSPRQLAQLIAKAKKEGVKVLFAQPQYDQRSASVVAAGIGGSVLTIDPLAKDILNNFNDIAQKLETSFVK